MRAEDFVIEYEELINKKDLTEKEKKRKKELDELKAAFEDQDFKYSIYRKYILGLQGKK